MLRQLEYLCALAREGHFRRAADACHISQPALSAGIRKLEAELGVQIVQRGRRFEGFTPEGDEVLRWARRIIADQQAMRHELASRADGLSGVLRLGVIPTALTVASMITAPLRERHPLVRFSLESMSSREISHRLNEFDIDVGMTYVDGEPLGSVRVMPMYRERYLLLTPGASEYGRRTSVSWAEAATQPLCLLSPVMQNRRIIDRAFVDAGVTVTPTVEADTVAGLYSHVRTMGLSSVIAHAWLPMFGIPEGMRVVPLPRPARSHQVGLVFADRDPVPLLARATLDVARSVNIGQDLTRLLRGHLPGEAPSPDSP